MNKLDFLSGGPKTIIFERDSNKTNLGGVLTLIYLIVVILISIAYIYEYSVNNTYSVSYSYDYQVSDDEEFLNKRYSNENYNQKLNYSLELEEPDDSSNFGIFYSDHNHTFPIYFNTNYISNLYDISFFVYYNCGRILDEEEECKIRDEDKPSFNTIYIDFNYLGFQLDHQNEESPIKREDTYNIFSFNLGNKIYMYQLRWKTIEYSEEKGFFDNIMGKSNTVYGGEFIDPIVSILFYEDLPQYYKDMERNLGIKILGMIGSDKYDPKNYYDKYSRTKKSIFDSIANICSLSMTVYSGFIFVFCGFYSSKYDNYKIVEKILLQSKKEKIIKR